MSDPMALHAIEAMPMALDPPAGILNPRPQQTTGTVDSLKMQLPNASFPDSIDSEPLLGIPVSANPLLPQP